MNVEIVANPKTQGLAFKFFVVIALVVLFALFLYAILGPLPSQSKFLKQSGVANTLAVNGTSLLNGDVVIGGNTAMNGIMNVIGVARAQTSLSTPEIDLITTASGIDTVQGTIKGLISGTTQISGSSNVKVTDSSGTNTVAQFTGINQQTDFYGDVILSGNSSLVLENQSSSNPSYELFNDSNNSDFTLRSKNGSLIKNIIDANSLGSSITLLDASAASPVLYINGAAGLGKVYDDKYFIPPSVNPTLGSLTVTGTSSFGGAVTASNNLTVNGVLNTRPNESDMQGISFYGPTQLQRGGRIAVATGDDLFIEGQTTVNISPILNANYIASFDTAQFTGTRSNKSVPGFDLKGYMKYTLPSYITEGGNTFNSYTYTSTSTATVTADANGWPSTQANYVGAWSSTQVGANAYIINTGIVTNSGWQCPKRGIWQVTFDSNLNSAVAGLSLAIGSLTTTPTSTPYGIDKVTTFVVINQNEIIAVTPQAGTGNLTAISPKMTFSLIMELNPATTS